MPGASGVQGRLTLSGCDLSAYDGTLFDVTNMHSNYPVVLRNCSLNSSATLRSGTANERYRIELYQTEADGAALGAGQSRRQFLVDAWNGTIENDLTFTRGGRCVRRRVRRVLAQDDAGRPEDAAELPRPWRVRRSTCGSRATARLRR